MGSITLPVLKRPFKLALPLLFLVVAACATAPEKAGLNPGLTKVPGSQETINLLKARRFEKLGHLISALQREYESGRRSESPVNAAFGAFAHADPALEKLLDEWVALEPGNSIPLMARSVFFRRLGWLARGADLGSRTSRRQFDEMGRYFNAAARDSLAALALNPKLAMAYDVLISFYVANGKHGRARKVFDEAEKQLERASDYIWTLAWHSGREWTGAPGALDSLLARSERPTGPDDRYRVLAGYRDYRAAKKLYRDKKYAEAAAHFDRAIDASGRNPTYLLARARNHWMRDRDDDALEDTRQVLKNSPENSSALNLMARIYSHQKKPDVAIGYANKAVALDPYDPAHLMVRAELRRQTKAWVEGNADLDRALVFGGYRAPVHAARAQFFASQGRPATTVKLEWGRAVELAPHEEDYWQRYMGMLAVTADCAAGSVAVAYLRQCLPRRTCGAKDIMRLSFLVNGVTDSARCPYERHFVAKNFSSALTEPDRRLVRKHDNFDDHYAKDDKGAGRSNVRGFVLEGLRLGARIDEVQAAFPDIKIHRQYVPNTKVMVMAVARGRTRDGSADLTIAFSHDGKAHTIHTMRTVEIAAAPHDIERLITARRAELLAPYGKPERVITNGASGKRSFEFRQTGPTKKRIAALVLEQEVPVVRGRNRGKAVYQVKIGLGMVDDELMARSGDEVRKIAMRLQAARPQR